METDFENASEIMKQIIVNDEKIISNQELMINNLKKIIEIKDKQIEVYKTVIGKYLEENENDTKDLY